VVQCALGVATDDGRCFAVEAEFRQKLTGFQLDQINQLRVVHEVALVEEHNQLGDADRLTQVHPAAFSSASEHVSLNSPSITKVARCGDALGIGYVVVSGKSGAGSLGVGGLDY